MKNKALAIFLSFCMIAQGMVVNAEEISEIPVESGYLLNNGQTDQSLKDLDSDFSMGEQQDRLSWRERRQEAEREKEEAEEEAKEEAEETEGEKTDLNAAALDKDSNEKIEDPGLKPEGERNDGAYGSEPEQGNPGSIEKELLGNRTQEPFEEQAENWDSKSFEATSPQELADLLGIANVEIDGNKLTLKNNIVLSSDIIYQAGVTDGGLVLDLAGYSITSDSVLSAISIKNPSAEAELITIRSGSIHMSNVSSIGINIDAPKTEVVLEDLTVYAGLRAISVEHGGITVKGGTYTGGQFGLYAAYAEKVVVEQGSFSGTDYYGIRFGKESVNIQLNGGVCSGGTGSFDGDVFRLADVLGSGKTAYHYESGSRTEMFSQTELFSVQVNDAFEVADGESVNTIDISGSIDITDFDPDNSYISLIQKENETIGRDSKIESDGTFVLRGVPDGDYFINLVLKQDGYKKVKRNGFKVQGGTVLPEGAEHIKLGHAHLHGILERENYDSSEITMHLQQVGNSDKWYENQYTQGESYDINYIDSGMYHYLLTTSTGEQVAGTIFLKDDQNQLHQVILPDNLGSHYVYGSILNAKGESITASTIKVQQKDGSYEETFTDKNEFTLVDLPDGSYEITAIKDGLSGNSSFTVSGGKITSGSTIVVVSSKITGQVMQEVSTGANSPLLDAELTFINTSSGTEYTAVTGAGGAYTMPSMLYGEYLVRIKTDQFTTGLGSVTIDGRPYNSGINFLVGSARLTGQVTNTLGKKMSGVTITAVKNMSNYHFTPVDLVTGTDGTYLIEGLPSGTYSVGAKNKDGKTISKTVTITTGGRATADFVFEEAFGAAVGGIITNGSGEGIGGVTVQWKDDAGGLHEAVTRPDGSYTIDNLPDGTYEIILEGPWIHLGLGEADIVGGAYEGSVDFQLGSGGLGGVITDNQNRPVSGAQIVIKDKNSGLEYYVPGTTDSDGAYHISGIPDGDYQVTILAPNKQETVDHVIITGGSIIDADFQVPAGERRPSVIGTISAGTGPLEGITVILKDKNGVIHQAVTGPDGTYKIEGILDGSYVITAIGPGIHVGLGNTVIANGGASGKMDFELGTGGLMGSIRDDKNNLVNGAQVILTQKGSGQEYMSPEVSGQDGAYQIAGVPDGQYTVSINLAGRQDVITEVIILNGKVLDKDLIVSTGSGENGESGGGSGTGENSGSESGGNGSSGSGESGSGGNGSGEDGSGSIGEGGNDGDGAGSGGSGAGGRAPDNGNSGGGSGGGRASVDSKMAGDASFNVTIEQSRPGTLKGILGGSGMTGARVTVENKETGKNYTTEPGADGVFYIENLSDGDYTIKIIAKNSDVLAAEFTVSQGIHDLTISRFTLYKNSGKEPRTGDWMPSGATVAMIGGMAYLMDLFCEKKDISLGITENKKDELLKRIIAYARRKNRLIRLLAVGAVFLLLIFYYSIGKVTEEEARKMLHA